MPKQDLTPEQLEQVYSLGQQTPRLSNREIERRTGVHNTTVGKYRDIKPDVRPVLKETSEVAGDAWNISLPQTRIHTLEELIAEYKVDTDVWECEKFICRRWEMGYVADETRGPKRADGSQRIEYTAGHKGLYATSAQFKRHKNAEFAKKAIDRLLERLAKNPPKYPKIALPKSQTGNAAEFSVVDFHFGALTWGRETRWEDWDLKIAVKTWRECFQTLILRTRSFQPEKIVLVLGNDQQNSDNKAGNTEAGTPQNNDGRYEKVFDASLDNSIWAIDSCLAEAGKVDVVMVAGNHDRLTVYLLGKVLQAHYQNNPHVKIDNSPSPRKYYEHGVNMLLFTHGDKGKLEDYGATMAAEQPEMWGRTKWREAHTGDKHNRRMVEHKGATVRILPSLRPSCAWSSENHYIGSIRAAEAYVWNAKEGLIGTACYSVLREAK